MRPSAKLSKRGKTVIGLAVLASIDSTSVHAATQTSTWIGSGGSDWNTATNWSPTGVPNNGTNGFTDYNVIIGTPSPTILDISPTIDSLTVNASAQLTINPAFILTIAGPTVTNNGLIQIDTLISNAAFNFSGNTLLTGSGVVLLNDYNPNARITANAGVTLTQDVNSKIGGVGEIDAALVNNGIVNANYSGHTLALQTYNMSNNKLFEATNGATLSISGINITQGVNGQTLSTAGTAVNITNCNISGGMISSAGTGVVNVNSSTFNNVNITSGSLVVISPATTLNITGGSLINNGTVQIDTNSSNANLNFIGNTSITGTGNIYLYDNNPRPTINASAGAVVTLSAGQTIFGEGTINAGLVDNGVINANVSGQSIVLQTNAMTNNNLFEATGGGSLNISGITLTQGAGAQLFAGSNSAVNINGSTIVGGTLNASSGTSINLTSTTLSSVAISTGSSVILTPGTTVNIVGTLVNNGQIQIDNNISNANLNFTNTITVTGTGSIYLFDNNPRPTLNTSAGATVTFSSGQTIFGEGTINASLINNGIINANYSGQSLLLQTNAMTNNNIFEATNNGTLSINGITVTQGTVGTITAYNNSAVSIYGGANISGGTITSTASGIINVSTATFNNGNISSGTQVVVAPATTLNITGGTLVNNGLIQVDTNTSNANLNFIGDTAITGTGGIFLYDDNPRPTLNSSTGSTVTLSSGQTVYGEGTINAALVNNGIINANISGHSLVVQTNSISNNNLLEATGGATLGINGILVTQAAGATISASNTSAISIYGGANISGGTLSAATGGTIYTSNATFNNVNISTGTLVVVQTATALNITGTSLIDNGLIQVDQLTSNASLNFNSSIALTGTGSIFLDDYNPNAKLATAPGVTLTQSAGNTIYGVGEIDAALINNGTVNATFSGRTLFLQNGPVTNNGLLEATNGSTLNINAINITQGTNGLIKADATSAISINNSNISNGTIASAPGGAINVNTAKFSSVNISTGSQVNVAASTTLAVSGSISTGNGIGLSIGDNATVTFAPAANVSNRALVILSSFTNTGRLDLGNNDLDVIGGNLSAITSLLATGARINQGGSFNGTSGITSISAASDTTHLFALGAIQNNQSGTALFSASRKFDGYAPAPADILVKYTYFGDANLDGKVDASDYSRIDTAFISEKTGPAVTTWFNGDFNYDGVVNGSDYTLIDNGFNRQGAQVTSELAAATAQLGGSSAVPEPTSIGMVVLTAGVLARRRPRASLAR